MVKNYYIVKNGKQTGPHSAKQILTKSLTGEFEVWTSGMSDWKTYATLSAFKEDMKPKTKGLPNPNSSSNPVSGSSQLINEANNLDRELASHGRRLLASILHGIIFWTITLLFISADAKEGVTLLVMLLVLSLNLVSYHFKSGNLGHNLLGLKVIHADSKEDYNNPILGLVREIVKGILSWFMIPFVILFFNDKRQNLYDMMFNTLVVKINISEVKTVRKSPELVKGKEKRHGEDREYRR